MFKLPECSQMLQNCTDLCVFWNIYKMVAFRFVVFWSHLILSISLENIAFNKSATQSSNLHEKKWLAGTAVDGNGNQVLSGNSCACTALYKPTVWWKVDLGNVYAISEVKIFYNNEGNSYRLSGFKLYMTLHDNFISSNPVYVHNNGVHDANIIMTNFTAKVATYGQYLAIYKDRSLSCVPPLPINPNFCALFELCEVEVLGCPKKKYGTDCQSDCPDNCLYDVCVISDGKCYQCKAGYTGDMCDQPCRAGSYGFGCSQTCSGNCRGGATCDVSDGTCSTGCSDGYKGNYCNETCSPGKFGTLCSFTCGSCRDNITCNHINGSCPTGCGLGVMGQYCKTACIPGKYGYNCNESCIGNCLNGLKCYVQTGHCGNGCTAGWKGEKCDKVCNNGTYGRNCLRNCTGNCANETACNKLDGSCQYGCKNGWKGNICNEECKRGEYGPNCYLLCGKCNNSMACERQEGICPQGCADGYKGITCKQRCDFDFYGRNCSLQCMKCNTTCDHVTGECPVSDAGASPVSHDLKMPFVIYGVISSVIICFSAVLNIWLLRKSFQHSLKNHINTNEFELPDKPDLHIKASDSKNKSVGDTTTMKSSRGEESKTEKYEELRQFDVDGRSYETLKKGKESVKSQDRKVQDAGTTKVTVDGDKNYEELHAGFAENSYETLHSDGDSKYANA